jgi:Protein of unknown function (DUF559)
LTLRGNWMAALLALPGSALSHQTAAAVWDLRRSEGRVHLTVSGHRGRPRPDLVIHAVRTLDPHDVTKKDGFPVTTVARTLLDLAEVLQPTALHRAYEAAETERVLDVSAIEDLLERSPGRHGLRPLRALLEQARPPEPAARSELERLFLDLCHEQGIPQPVVNGPVEGREVDMLWPAAKLIAELDGHHFHGTRTAFERDRARDAALQRAGYRVVRITHRRLVHEPELVADDIRTLLAASHVPTV